MWQVELGSLKEWDCTATGTAVRQAGVIVANVRRLVNRTSGGGSSDRPQWLCMDEPLHSAGPSKVRRTLQNIEHDAARMLTFAESFANF